MANLQYKLPFSGSRDDGCARGTHDMARSWLEQATAANSPKVAVAVVVRENTLGKFVLLVRRAARGEDALDWVFPGGKVEAGETPNRAAQRELLEEAGIVAKYPKQIGQRVHPRTGVNIFYVAFRQASDKLHEVIDKKISESAWVNVENLDTYCNGEIFSAVRRHLKLDEQFPLLKIS